MGEGVTYLAAHIQRNACFPQERLPSLHPHQQHSWCTIGTAGHLHRKLRFLVPLWIQCIRAGGCGERLHLLRLDRFCIESDFYMAGGKGKPILDVS